MEGITPLIQHAIGFVLVAICWGFTNPFIKLGSAGLENIKRDTWLTQTLAEWKYLFTRWQYVFPLALNLCGSVVYYYTLGKADLSLAVPIANSLTFVFTYIGEAIIASRRKEKTAVDNDTGSFLGMALVCAGVALCVQSKIQT